MPKRAPKRNTATVPHEPRQSVADLVSSLSRGAPDLVVSASARLIALLDKAASLQDGIAREGGLRSAVFLLKMSVAAGYQRIASAASQLLTHLARDNPANQDEICKLEGIPCLVDVVATFGEASESTCRPRSRSSSHGCELLEITEAVRSAAEALGLLAARHAREIARAGGVEVLLARLAGGNCRSVVVEAVVEDTLARIARTSVNTAPDANAFGRHISETVPCRGRRQAFDPSEGGAISPPPSPPPSPSSDMPRDDLLWSEDQFLLERGAASDVSDVRACGMASVLPILQSLLSAVVSCLLLLLMCTTYLLLTFCTRLPPSLFW